MPKVRKEIPELEKLVQVGRKKFVRYEEGAQLYSIRLRCFLRLERRWLQLNTSGKALFNHYNRHCLII